jgi:predicted nucleic acid-binding protein
VKIAVDTNVLVRYLTWDDEEQAVEAAAVLESGDVIVISTIVLCELVWVLKRAYRCGCWPAAATLPMASSNTMPVAPDATVWSPSTKISPA